MKVKVGEIEVDLDGENLVKYQKKQKEIIEKDKKIHTDKKKKINELNETLKALNNKHTIIQNIPIMERDIKLNTYSNDVIIDLLNKALIYDIKEIKSRKRHPVGMFCNVRYVESDNAYYGDIYLRNLEYQKFKQVQHVWYKEKQTGIIKAVVFYVKKS